MSKKGFVLINEVSASSSAGASSSSSSWLMGLTGGVIAAIVVSAVIAIVFGVLITNLRNDLNAANARSTSSTGALQELVMELAEMGGLNTTYEEIVSGHCQTNNGCFDDVYIGSYRLLLARVGPLTALVAEVGPLATLDVKKKKLDPHTRTAKRRGTARAPGDGRIVECYNDGDPFAPGELFSGQITGFTSRVLDFWSDCKL